MSYRGEIMKKIHTRIFYSKIKNFKRSRENSKVLQREREDCKKRSQMASNFSIATTDSRKQWREFPGSPVVRTLSFHCRGRGFNPWSGKNPMCQKKKKREREKTVEWYFQNIEGTEIRTSLFPLSNLPPKAARN